MHSSKKNSASQVTTALLGIREWERENLPSPQSSLAYEIFLFIAHYSLIDQPLTLKQLFLSLNYSETAIREQLSRLIDEGLCRIEGGIKDKRLKHIIACPSMLELIDKYAIQLADSISVLSVDYKDSSSNSYRSDS